MKSTAKTNNMNSKIKVPWEPYKAAVGAQKTQPSNTYTNTNTSHRLPPPSSHNHHLIKYKIETNLDLFNMERPGYQFDEIDLKTINENNGLMAMSLSKSVTLEQENKEFNNKRMETKVIKNNDKCETTKLPPIQLEPSNFFDARFYPDVHFLKLASQLRKKCMPDQTGGGSSVIATKPVNVVGPLIEKKKTDAVTEASVGLTDANNPYGADKNSIKYWKQQQIQYESEIDYLKGQIGGINEQLQIQTQVNVELKKLLVASIGGEDLQYKLERLVNDKQRYEIELSNNGKIIEKLTEDLEQVSIQCDLWRSKFLASRLMNDENSTWRSFLLLLSLQNENVIRNLVQDNGLLNEKLNQALDLIVKYNNEKSGTNKFKSKNSNNFQAANLLLANLNHLCSNQIEKTKKFDFISLKQLKNHHESPKTLNESIAQHFLEQFDWLKTAAFQIDPNLKQPPTSNELSASPSEPNFTDSLEKLEKLIQRIRLTRTSTYGRLFQSANNDNETDLFLNVCNKCTGKVKVV